MTNSPLAIPYRQKYLGDVYLPFSVGSTIFYFIHLHIQALAARILSLDPILCYLRRLCDNDYHDNYPPNHLQRFTNHNQYPHKLPSPPKKQEKKIPISNHVVYHHRQVAELFSSRSHLLRMQCVLFPPRFACLTTCCTTHIPMYTLKRTPDRPTTRRKISDTVRGSSTPTE